MPSRIINQIGENVLELPVPYFKMPWVEPDRLLRMGDLLELFGYKSPQSIYNKLQPGNSYYDPDFPKQVDLGNDQHRGAARWSARAIFRYIAARPNRSSRGNG